MSTWYNVVVEVEVMISTEEGTAPDLKELEEQIRNAVEQDRGTWAMARNAVVINEVTE